MEIRPVSEADDFGEEFTPELRESERQLRAQTDPGASPWPWQGGELTRTTETVDGSSPCS